MGITCREENETRLFELTYRGRVTRADYLQAIAQAQGFIDRHGTIRLVEVIEDFSGFDSSILWPGLIFDVRNFGNISHVAVVSDSSWIAPASKAAGAILPALLRSFDIAHLEAARAWARRAA